MSRGERGTRGTESLGCLQEVREVPSWLPAQLEPNKAGLGCPGLESPINGASRSIGASKETIVN